MPSPSTPPRPLTPKQTRFVAEYLKDLYATQAYIRAGYSKNGADRSAYALLRNAEIAAAVSMSQAAERAAERPQVAADGRESGRKAHGAKSASAREQAILA